MSSEQFYSSPDATRFEHTFISTTGTQRDNITTMGIERASGVGHDSSAHDVPIVSEHSEKEQDRLVAESWCNYLHALEEMGILSGVLIGERKGEEGAYMWNVFSNDFHFEADMEEAVDRLHRLMFDFETKMRAIIPLRMSSVNPSRLENLIRQCDKQEIDTTYLRFG